MEISYLSRVIKYDIPYIYKSFKIKNSISKDYLFYNNERIDLKLKEELGEKFTYKEIFFGEYITNTILSIEKNFLLINENRKMKYIIIRDVWGDYYLKVTEDYYRKLDKSIVDKILERE